VIPNSFCRRKEFYTRTSIWLDVTDVHPKGPGCTADRPWY